MNIYSNGQLTDIHLLGADTQHIVRHTEQGEYTVVFTPSNPHFYCANMILFSASFLSKNNNTFTERIKTCRKLFLQELTPLYEAHSAVLKHVTLGWDIEPRDNNVLNAETIAMIKYDSRFHALHVLSKRGETDAPDDIGYTFREIDMAVHDETASEWQQFVQSKIQSSEHRDAELFMPAQHAFYHSLIAQNKGKWFGAFDGTKLVANFGIFTVLRGNQTIARFQEVHTHPNYRRKGICRNLIRYAMRQFDDSTVFNIITDAGGDAERVYSTIGFEPKEVLYGYCEHQQ